MTSPYAREKITLGRLVKLAHEFLHVAEYALEGRGLTRKDSLASLTVAEQQQLHTLDGEIKDINAEASLAIQDGNNDPVFIGALTAKMNRVSLQMNDLLIQGAQNKLGREFMIYMAPDEFRQPEVQEILTQNRACTLLDLTRPALQ